MTDKDPRTGNTPERYSPPSNSEPETAPGGVGTGTKGDPAEEPAAQPGQQPHSKPDADRR